MADPVDKKKLDLAIQWLRRSIDINRGNGSSAFYHPLKGWASAYPETTGYLIPTMIKVGQNTKDDGLISRAMNCADWLCNIQLADGHFPAGPGGTMNPNVFDTGQIILGLTTAYKEWNCDHYFEALNRSVNKLLEIQEKDGSWQKDAYVKGYSPAYYSRVVWAVLMANEVLNIPGLEDKMVKSLEYYSNQITEHNSFDNWGFRTGEAALTHTIAYTIRGFLESGQLLQDSRHMTIAEDITMEIIELLETKGKLAGSYRSDWQGDYSFICVPGHFQMVVLFNRIYNLTNQEGLKKWAELLFREAQKAQAFFPIKGIKGGYPGSSPVWGKYQRFKWLNWSVKFYLDAVYSF